MLSRLQTEGKISYQPTHSPNTTGPNPSGAYVRVTGKGWEVIQILKTTLKENTTTAVHRQITIDSQKIDIRSGEVYSILFSEIGPLTESAAAMCRQVLSDEVYMKTRRQCQAILHKILRLRGRDISANSPEIYDQIVIAVNHFIHAPKTKRQAD